MDSPSQARSVFIMPLPCACARSRSRRTLLRVNRRRFLRSSAIVAAFAAARPLRAFAAPQLAVTMDDFNLEDEVFMPAVQRSRRILAALGRHRAPAAAFVIGRFIDTPVGDEVLDSWAEAGHIIGNHSYSHHNYHAASTGFVEFSADFIRNHALLKDRAGFVPLFRFPFLREGNTAEKRDRMRQVLRAHGYRNGHVTIDTADWLIDRRLRERLRKDKQADTRPYRDLYLRHMLSFCDYHRRLAVAVLGADVPHTLLTHFNILNALYLDDALAALAKAGWQFLPAKQVFAHELYKREPNILPAGNSLLWAIATEGNVKHGIPAPLENQDWLEQEMDRLKL